MDAHSTNRELGELLISVLRSYPKYEKKYLDTLISDPGTRNIGEALLDKNVSDLSASTFEEIGKKGEYLCDYGFFLTRFGREYGKKDFLNLAIKLFERGKESFTMEETKRGSALMNEAIARMRIAELGVDSVDQLV